MLADSIERTQVGWRFGLWWLLASMVAFLVAYPGAATAARAVEETVGQIVGSAVSGAAFGASLGIAQWLVLRRQVSRPGRWVWASTAGSAVAFTTGHVASEAVGLVVFGASIGIAQWFVLRQWQVSRAGWWVLASIVAFPVAFTVFSMLEPNGFAMFTLGGAAYGAITGGVLVWLLRKPVTEGSSHPQANVEVVFWFLWVFATAAGLLVGVVIDNATGIFPFFVYFEWGPDIMEGAIRVEGGLVGFLGLGVGISQWLVLRKRLPKAAWWIVASLLYLVVQDIPEVSFTVRGLGIGIAQWLVLRRHFARAGWWILASGLGWSIGLVVGNAVVSEVGVLLANILFGGIAGAITGALLVWFFREPAVQETELGSDLNQSADPLELNSKSTLEA